jgi:hypothetical protein
MTTTCKIYSTPSAFSCFSFPVVRHSSSTPPVYKLCWVSGPVPSAVVLVELKLKLRDAPTLTRSSHKNRMLDSPATGCDFQLPRAAIHGCKHANDGSVQLCSHPLPLFQPLSETWARGAVSKKSFRVSSVTVHA